MIAYVITYVNVWSSIMLKNPWGIFTLPSIHTHGMFIKRQGVPMARNKYPEETVKKILDVAERLFAERGYEHTTMADIVAGLDGLTKGAVYHHFKSKEGRFLFW